MIGTFGNAEIFSFHATKYLNSFEGGAIVTNDDDLAVRVRLMRNYGFAGYDDVVSTGTNGKMTEVAAAMGLTSLESIGEFIDVNYRNYVRYKLNLADFPGISMLSYDENEKCNYQYIILEIDDSASKINRNQIQNILWAENVLARRYFYPGCHRMAPYRSRQPALRLPHTEELANQVLNLPNGTTVDVESIDVICNILKFAIARGDEINHRIKDSSRSVPIPDR